MPVFGGTSRPGGPKYRLEGVTAERIRAFFHDYTENTLTRYLRPAADRAPVVVTGGIRVLSSWDFREAVQDPAKSVLVYFHSDDCDACDEFDVKYAALARRVTTAQRVRDGQRFNALLVAKIDQSREEHGEEVSGTPALRYYPRGREKRAEAIKRLDEDDLWNLLEDKLAEENSEDRSDEDEVAATCFDEEPPVLSREAEEVAELEEDPTKGAAGLYYDLAGYSSYGGYQMDYHIQDDYSGDGMHASYFYGYGYDYQYNPKRIFVKKEL
eukprot:TRINITY_DN47013_c0_g1_i1.p1 TRINITY_DN47013_c0_g1~~TRINITY_DN47013_c0_g1_i1.p1  ORF type:complete len:269 (-),score=68.13 TRINITY_DN47013_c0_g1_i1:44-850(-)